MLIKNGALLCALLALAVPAWADAPIAPGAVSPMTREDYPKTFAKWGAAGVKKINEMAPRAAAFAARSSECDRVEIVELSDARSIPGKSIVFFADCRNGKRFYVSDTDIAAGNEVVSQTAKMANMDDGEAILACEIAVKAQLQYPSSFKQKMLSSSVRRAETTGNVVVTFDFEAMNGLGMTMPQSARCVISDLGMAEATITKR